MKGVLKILYEECPGDREWDEFVNVFDKVDDVKMECEEVDLDMLRVMVGKLGPGVDLKNWANSSKNMLAGRSIIDVLRNVEGGRYIVRNFLMRLP